MSKANATIGFARAVGKNFDEISTALKRIASGSVDLSRGSYTPSGGLAFRSGKARQPWQENFRARVDLMSTDSNVPDEAKLVFRKTKGTYIGRFEIDNKPIKNSLKIEWPQEALADGAQPIPYVDYRARYTSSIGKDGKERRAYKSFDIASLNNREQKAALRAMSQNVERSLIKTLDSATRGDQDAIMALNWYPIVGRNIDEVIVEGLKKSGYSDESARYLATELFSASSPRTLVVDNATATAQLASGNYTGSYSPINADTVLSIASGFRRGPGLWRGGDAVKTDMFQSDTESGLLLARALGGVDLNKQMIDLNRLQNLISTGVIPDRPSGTVDMWAEELLIGIDPFQGSLLNLSNPKSYELLRKVFKSVADEYGMPEYMVQSGTWETKAKAMLRSRPATSLEKLFSAPFKPDPLIGKVSPSEYAAATLARAANSGSAKERETLTKLLGSWSSKNQEYTNPDLLKKVQGVLQKTQGKMLGIAPVPLAGSALTLGTRQNEKPVSKNQNIWGMARSPYIV